MSNLLEHLKEMKSQAELVDAWQEAFDVAIDLCTDLQSENERIEYERGVAQGNVTLQMDLRAIAERGLFTLQEKYDNLKLENERLNSPVLKSEWQQLQEKCDNLKEENVKLAEEYLTAGIQKIIAQEKYDKLKLGSERYREALEIETVGRVLAEKHRNILQEKYDKLNERVEGAPKVRTKKGNGILGEHVELDIDTNINKLNGDYALVELTPEEMEKS